MVVIIITIISLMAIMDTTAITAIIIRPITQIIVRAKVSATVAILTITLKRTAIILRLNNLHNFHQHKKNQLYLSFLNLLLHLLPLLVHPLNFQKLQCYPLLLVLLLHLLLLHLLKTLLCSKLTFFHLLQQQQQLQLQP